MSRRGIKGDAMDAAGSLAPRTKGTIGIIGLDLVDVAELNRKIVEYGNSIGFKDDQDHPNLIAIGIPADGKKLLKDMANLCSDYGCDVVAIHGNLDDAALSELAQDTETILLANANLDELAKDVVDYACSLEKTRRPNLVHKENGDDDEKVRANITQDQDERIARVAERSAINKQKAAAKKQELEGEQAAKRRRTTSLDDDSAYPELQRYFPDMVGILGGAGPLASATALMELAHKGGVPSIHISDNCAPGKHRFTTNQGPHYASHYISDMNFFEMISVGAVAIPCNTAHAHLKDFCNEKMRAKVVDIRAASLSALCADDSLQHPITAILVGTDQTIGLVPGRKGTYEEFRELNFSGEISHFVVPSREQQDSIMEAIYQIKEGRDLPDAKRKIADVILALREQHGPTLPAMLACTELGLPFTGKNELATFGCKDSLVCLADATQKRLAGLRASREGSRSAASSTASSGRDSDAESTSPQINYLHPSNLEHFLQKAQVTAWKDDAGTIRITVEKKDASIGSQDLRHFTNSLCKAYRDTDSTKDRVVTKISPKEVSTASFHKPKPELQDWIDTNNIAKKQGNPHKQTTAQQSL